MIIWPPKDPDETVAYTVDWSEQLGTDAIASYTMVVSSGDATIEDERQSVRALKFYIAGGTNDTTTTFLNTVTTNTGQVLERLFSLYVGDGQSSFLTTSTTKRQLVEQMFTECALNGWEYDLTPEEKDTALTRLDALMWELRGRGIDVGYNFPNSIGGGSLNDDLGCPDQAFFGLSVLGAKRLCPTMGKALSKESREALNDAMKAVRSAASGFVPTVLLAPGTPIGSGNKPWSTRYPYSMTE